MHIDGARRVCGRIRTDGKGLLVSLVREDAEIPSRLAASRDAGIILGQMQ